MQLQNSDGPWYSHPIMWMVVAPPIGAVLAGILTMALILRAPERDVRIPHPDAAVIHGNAHSSVVPPSN